MMNKPSQSDDQTILISDTGYIRVKALGSRIGIELTNSHGDTFNLMSIEQARATLHILQDAILDAIANRVVEELGNE